MVHWQKPAEIKKIQNVIFSVWYQFSYIFSMTSQNNVQWLWGHFLQSERLWITQPLLIWRFWTSDTQTFRSKSSCLQHLNNQPPAHRLHRHGYCSSHAEWPWSQKRGGDRRVQAEACHMHPLPGTSHGGQSKKTTSPALCRGRRSSGGR